MTRAMANEILYLWKVGAEVYPSRVITQALYITGDLSGPDLETSIGLVRVPGMPAWVEGSSLALGEGTSQGAPSVLLAPAGVVGDADAACPNRASDEQIQVKELR